MEDEVKKALEHLGEIDYNTYQTQSHTSNTSDGINKIVELLEKQNLLLEQLIIKLSE